jgi:transcriptional regulator with XRE-family HTH domain
LARALRDLRESEWPEELTQAQLAKALSKESRVAPATLSSWESAANPKSPSESRLLAYARFFATRRSLDGEPHLIPEKELEPEERERFHELQERLLGLFHAGTERVASTLEFGDGPVVVICPEAPSEARGQLARERDPNFTKLQQYADLDALIEIYGHLRAANPDVDIFHRLPSDVVADDLSTHVILLGGIGWNHVTRRFLAATGQVPITQVDNKDYPSGEIFTVTGPDGSTQSFSPEWDDLGGGKELVADVAFLARLRNPFRVNRTLTICNGVHSRGVLGAVRCLTDARVREPNEKYLAQRFPEGQFAVLLRVPVMTEETMSPDLENPEARLYEWPPTDRPSR